MTCPDNLSSDQKTILTTILTLLSASNLNTVDKADLGRLMVYIGQVMLIDAAFEAKEASEQANEAKVKTLQDQITCLTKQMDDIKRGLRGT